MKKLSKIAQGFSMLALVCALAAVSFAQTTTGVVRGSVTDPNGAVVPNAKVTISQKSTNTAQTAQTTSGGEFQFSNLLVGDYVITVEATNFKKLTLNDVKVQLNQATGINAQLTVGLSGETVEVTAAGAELIDTTTANLSSNFSSRQAVDLAQTSIGSGINNLALLAGNVSSSGGVGVGTGGSVGGQRPRDNNFVVDGIDNNDKGVTGPQSYISPEEVAEFSLIQNQFSAEYARSNGGQFITVTKSGSKEYHGSAYGFVQNKKLDALDNADKRGGVTRATQNRYDRFRGGANFSGPIPAIFTDTENDGRPKLRQASEKVFFFTSYERLQAGFGGGAAGVGAPTAAGRALISGLTGVSNTNRNVLLQFLPTAARQDTNCGGPCFTTVNGVNIPLGTVSISAPNFFKQNHVVANVDVNQSATTTHRVRFSMTNFAGIDTAASLPQFFIPIPNKQRLFSYTLIHNFSSNVVNETRIGFRRSSNSFNVPDINFPGLAAFPNIQLDDLGVNIGPDPNAPQFAIESNYQMVDNVTVLRGNHSFKFGGDFRVIVSPQQFTQRLRGDYEYGSLETYLRDLSPDIFGERNAGNNIYYGNQKILYAFAQDDWRIRQNLTLNLGVNYSYQQVPLGARTSQALNSISSVPGLLDFRAPKSQTKNFSPKIGFAYSPDFGDGMLGSLFGKGKKTSIRAGFSKGYDYIFDNLYILSNPPQLQQTNDVDTTTQTTNFLLNGGLPNTPVAITSAAVARAATGSFIPDQKVPYSLTYTGSIQRQFGNDWSLELRYLGTRGVHLLTQNRLNRQTRVGNGLSGLPTFLAAPTQAQLDALTLTLTQIDARPNFVPRYANAGFNRSNLVAFLANGNSSYNGASATLTKRFSRGLAGTAAYTWSHLIDDTTAEVFSTVLSPRRVADFQNLRAERANSALDHRHRFVTSFIYDVPFFNNGNGLARSLVGGWSVAGTYSFETGEFVTIRSGNDANRNGDSAGDRAILNLTGTQNVGSPVTALRNTAGAIVGYLATNPSARYIQTGNGAISTIGRNTFRSPSINNLDMSIFKNFRTGEHSKIQFRADFLNALNHPQYVPGGVNDVAPVATTGVTSYNTVFPLNAGFLKADTVFASHARVIQLALRYNF